MLDIIIPVYNSQQTISKTLESIYKQTIQASIEVYIIDDGSKESYDDILKKYDKVHYYKYLDNKGPGFAREYGMKLSKSEYIMFMDSDDYLYDDMALEHLLDSIKKGDYDAVYGITEEESDTGKIVSYYEGFDTIHSKIYKRTFLNKNRITFPHIYNSEDIAFNNLVIMNTANIGCSNNKVYVYKWRKNSLTKTDYYDKIHIKCYCESLKWVLDNAIRNNISKGIIARLLESSFSYFYYYYYIEKNDMSSIKYLNTLMLYYDNYINYLNFVFTNAWLDYWTRYRKKNVEDKDYFYFLDLCRKNAHNIKY